MRLLIDSADLAEIRELYAFYTYDGVTTNPALLSAVGGEPLEVLRAIRAFLPQGAELHAQVISQEAETMVQEARRLRREIPGIRVKVPVTRQGLRAIGLLAAEGVPVTATAVYTPMQGYLAARAGARHIAPYVSRIDDLGGDGVQAAKEIHDLLARGGYDCEVLGAAFRTARQLQQLCVHGVSAATAFPQVLRQLTAHEGTEGAAADFTKKFEAAFGPGATMLGC